MGWKSITGVVVVLLVVVISLVFFGGDSTVVPVEDASPGIVSVTQEKLRSISEIVNASNNQSIRIIAYAESPVYEKVALNRRNEKLNLNESVIESFGSKVFEGSLNQFLKKDQLERHNQKSVYYEQKLEFVEPFFLEIIEDKEFFGNNDEYTGFVLAKDSEVLSYVVTFVQDVPWVDLRESFIRFFGRRYYVADVSSLNSFDLWYRPVRFTLYEGEIVRIDHPDFLPKEFMIRSINDERVVLDLNGEKLINYIDGGSYREDELLVHVEEIAYASKSASSVTLVVAPSALVVSTAGLSFDNVAVPDFSVDFLPVTGDKLSRVVVTWENPVDGYVTSLYSLKIPFFNNLNLSLGKTGYEENGKYYSDVFLNSVYVESL